MNGEELQLLSSKINSISNLHIFDRMMQSVNTHKNSNTVELKRNFIEEIDEKMDKLENMKNVLKGRKSIIQIKTSKNEKDKKLNSRNKKISNRVSRLRETSAQVAESGVKIEKSSIENHNRRMSQQSNLPFIAKQKSEIIGHGANLLMTKSNFNIFKTLSHDDSTYNSLKENDGTKRTMKKRDSKISKITKIQNVLTASNTELINVHNSPPLFKLRQSESDKIINDNEMIHNGRRKVVSLIDRKNVEHFVEKVTKQEERRPQLSPKLNIDKFIKNGSPFNDIYSKCERQMKFADALTDLLNREKAKVVTNSKKENDNMIKNLVKAQDNYIFELEENNKNKNGRENVFLYNSGGKGKNQFSKLDKVTKISEKFAFMNRSLLIEEYCLNSYDPEFIFIYENSKLKESDDNKLLNKRLVKKETDKHSLVENFLDSTNKGKDNLINKIDQNINMLNKKKENKLSSEVFYIDYMRKVKKPNKSCKSPKLSNNQNKSMNDLETYLPTINKNQ